MQNEKISDFTDLVSCANERKHTWRERFHQQVEQAKLARKSEAAERLKTKSERDRYMDVIAKEYKMPELIQDLRKLWKIEKEYGFWYVRFDDPQTRGDVIILLRPKTGLLVLGLDRDGINKMARLAETFQPRPLLTTSDRFIAHKIKLPQIVELLEVAQELLGNFARPDFLPTIEEWDLADE